MSTPSREAFEEAVYLQRFLRDPEGCPEKALLLAPDESGDYADDNISAMWFGWRLARGELKQ